MADSRISQGPVEVLMTDNANAARVTQAVAETAQAQTATLRASQIIAEVIIPSVIESRVTQMVAELLYPTVIESRVTQAVAELVHTGLSETRVSQFVVEMLAKTSSYCGPPSLSPTPLCGKPDVLAWLEWAVPMKEN